MGEVRLLMWRKQHDEFVLLAFDLVTANVKLSHGSNWEVLLTMPAKRSLERSGESPTKAFPFSHFSLYVFVWVFCSITVSVHCILCFVLKSTTDCPTCAPGHKVWREWSRMQKNVLDIIKKKLKKKTNHPQDLGLKPCSSKTAKISSRVLQTFPGGLYPTFEKVSAQRVLS